MVDFFSPAMLFGSSGRTFAFVGSCVSNGTNLNFGSLSAGSVAADDLLVYVDHGYGGSPPSAVTPSGFTNVVNTSGGSGPGVRGMVSVKKAAGSEGSIAGISTDNRQKIGLVFRPSTAFTSITANDIATVINDGNPTSQNCDPSAETSAVILLGIAAADGVSVAFSTFSPSPDAVIEDAENDLRVGYSIFNTSPQATTVDINDLGEQNWLATLYLTVS